MQQEYQEDRARRQAEREAKEEMENRKKEREQQMKALQLAEKEKIRAHLAAEKKVRTKPNRKMLLTQLK